MENTATDPEKVVNEETGARESKAMTFSAAKALYDDFIKDNRERNKKNARITKKRDGEQPYDARKLKASGQSWRNNRPTGFMESVLKRLHSPYKQMVNQLPLLTYSKFPVKNLGTDAQRDTFRRVITDTIRGWDGWSDFLAQLISEDIDFGYAAVSWPDEYEWHPVMYRSDEAFFPVGCPQLACEVDTWALQQNFRRHELLEILEDPKTAQAAGWIVKNLAKKTNTAVREFDGSSSEDNVRVSVDLRRESSELSASTTSARVVKAGHIFTRSKTVPGVHHYIFDREDGTPLFYRANRYSKMEHSTCLFSAEVGDQTLHGSRGAGRALFNTHVSIEQARNLIQDALHLSGLLLLKKVGRAGSGSTENIPLSVQHPFAILGEGFEPVEKVRFEVNAEAFMTLDRQATAQAEVLVGAFMPGQASDAGDTRTASEINYVASIEAQIRAGILARFADQIFALITQLQRRICSPEITKLAEQIFEKAKETGKVPIMDKALFESLVEAEAAEAFIYAEIPIYIPEDSINAILQLLEAGLTKTQIIVLANSTSRASVEDAIASQSGILDMIVSRYSADPVIDTVELKRRDISSKLGAEAADRLMNVDLNPISPLKQVRIQASELATMLSGNDTPVDPTDDDKIHLSVIAARVSAMVSNPTVSPLASSQEFLQRVVAHADQHVESATNKGTKPEELAEPMQMIEQIRAFIQQPTTEAQAGAAMSAMAPQSTQVNGMTAVQPGDATRPSGPSSAIDTAASPPRPTPTGGMKQSPVPIIPQASETQP